MGVQTFVRSVNGNELFAEFVPWDSSTFGFDVCNLSNISIVDINQFNSIWSDFRSWIDNNNFKLITTRIGSSEKKNLEFLQENNFSVIESTLQPIISKLERFQPISDVYISNSSESQIPEIIRIAQSSFQFSRYHSDLQIGEKLANMRFANWIRNTSDLNNLKVSVLENDIVAFFLTERSSNESYWHLTAVNNDFKGRGLGQISWEKMLQNEFANGIELVKTRISVENLKVLNLYSKLGAKFSNSEVSLHLHI